MLSSDIFYELWQDIKLVLADIRYFIAFSISFYFHEELLKFAVAHTNIRAIPRKAKRRAIVKGNKTQIGSTRTAVKFLRKEQFHHF
jgi:hypothetical protein